MASKVYTKVHYSAKVAEAHKRKIEKRGGSVIMEVPKKSQKGLKEWTLRYSFPDKSDKEIPKIVIYYSKKTQSKIFEIENFGKVFVYWTYAGDSRDKKLLDSFPYSGSDEVDFETGLEIIRELDRNKKLYR